MDLQRYIKPLHNKLCKLNKSNPFLSYEIEEICCSGFFTQQKPELLPISECKNCEQISPMTGFFSA